MLNIYQHPCGFIANYLLPGHPNEYVYNQDSMFPLIVDCSYFDWQINTIPDDVISCQDAIQLVYNLFYYRCRSFLPPTIHSSKIRGLTAIFYLTDFADSRFNYFNSDVTLSESSGLKVAVHAIGTGSNIPTGEGIKPGTENLIHISQTKHTRLPMPYGNCSEQINLRGLDYKGDTLYTIDSCFEVCMQQIIVDGCHCLKAEHPFNKSQLDQGDESC